MMLRTIVAGAVAVMLGGVAMGETKTLYVSPEGNDGWTGALDAPGADKKDGPLATITKARDVARTFAPGVEGVIALRGGTYVLSETLKLDDRDSDLTIMTFAKEKVVITGGKPVGQFVPWKGEIVKADAAGQGVKGPVRQVFLDGKRQILARYPNFDAGNRYGGGWASVDGKVVGMYAEVPGETKRDFVAKGGDIHAWGHPEELEVFVFPRYNWWNNLVRVSAIDAATRKVTLAADASYAIRPGDRYFFQNALEELDAPGEWYWDAREGALYFWPPHDLNGPVYVPTLGNLIEATNTKNLTIRGMTLECAENGAVALNNCTQSLVAACTIRGIGNYSAGANTAVRINGGAKTGARGNDIYDVGGTASSISGGDVKTLTPAENFADDNHLHDFGVFYKQGVGVVLNGVGNRATHNLIHHGPRMGIMFSGNNLLLEFNEVHDVNLETEDTGAVYTGGRDWLGSRGTVIRYNYFHDIPGFGRDAKGVWKSPSMAWGVYLDDNAGGIDVIGNIIARCPRGLIHLHNGRDNHIENNILMDGTAQQVEANGWTKDNAMWLRHLPTMTDGYNSVKGQPAWRKMRGMDKEPSDTPLANGLTMTGNTFRRNIIYYTNPDAKLFKFSNLPTESYESDENVIWHVRSGLVVSSMLAGKETLAGSSWEAWKKLGFDQHSVLADPQFVDPGRDDYTLKAASPALKLKFEEIPRDKIGLYRHPDRATWPAEGTK